MLVFLTLLMMFFGCWSEAPAEASHSRRAPTVEAEPVDPPAVPRTWHEPVPERAPATKAAQKTMTLLEQIEAGMTGTRYQHFTRVRFKQGLFYWDCSGMADWIIRRTAPRAHRSLRRERPVARTFYRTIARSPTEGDRGGWQRLTGPEKIAPGDVFAWVKPPMFRKRKNTGHVGFVISTPQPHPRFANVWTLRIADATRIRHEHDSRPRGGEGGFGTATIAFLFHANGAPLAYGWYGSRQRPNTFVPTKIAFGRLVR